MEVQYFIKRIRTCEECKGSGLVYNHLWKKIFAALGGTNFTNAEALDYLRENEGLSYLERLPSEEIPCGECEGAGQITEEVDADEWLQQALLRVVSV